MRRIKTFQEDLFSKMKINFYKAVVFRYLATSAVDSLYLELIPWCFLKHFNLIHLIFFLYLKSLYLELLPISNKNFGPVAIIPSLFRTFTCIFCNSR